MHCAYALLIALPHPTIHREIKNLLGGRLGNEPYLKGWAPPRVTPSSQWENPVMTSWLFLERQRQQIRLHAVHLVYTQPQRHRRQRSHCCCLTRRVKT